MNKILRVGGMLIVSTAVILAGCSFETEAEPKQNRWDQIADEKNQHLTREALELKPYAKQVGARLSSPEYERFAVNSRLKVAGTVEKYETLHSDTVWIEMKKTDGPEGTGEKEFSYYVPLKDGSFSRSIQLFNGKGTYQVTVRLPSRDEADHYYDLAQFEVINVNPKVKRDIGKTRAGLKSELKLSRPASGYVEADGAFQLKGSLGRQRVDRVMVHLEKDGEKWKHLLRVDEKGRFDSQIPLFYGKGIHKLTVMTPAADRENYYHEAATLLIRNRSSEEKTPIQYFKHYDTRGIKLEYPLAGGGQGDMKYRIKGSIDPDAPYAEETEHLIVQTEKDGMEATYFVPVENYKFDGSFWLRFGEGEYEVTVNVPEITDEQRDYFRFFGVARFTVTNTAEKDLRNLLPSRGIQSEAKPIKQLARELTRGKETERAKALAIYNYVAKNIRYDVEKFNTDAFEYDDSALKTLKEKSGVCQDYSFLAIALLRSIDMEARFVEGIADGNRHAWVEVKVNGDWLTMDPTWGSGYINQNGQFVERYTTKYFDPNPSEFAKTHRRTGVMY